MDLTDKLGSFPLIETDRIRLRQLRSDDAPDLFEYYSNEAVYRYLDWNGPQTLERSHEVIEIWNQGYNDGWILRFAICLKSTDRVIGTIFLNQFEGRRAEVGYELSESYWRQGLMSEAMGAVLSLGFIRLGLSRIQAFVCMENIPSMELLSKLGFLREGCLRNYECHSVTGECKDMFVYGLPDSDFRL